MNQQTGIGKNSMKPIRLHFAIAGPRIHVPFLKTTTMKATRRQILMAGEVLCRNAERVRNLGSSGHLLKPVNESQLLAAIRAVIPTPLKPNAPSE